MNYEYDVFFSYKRDSETDFWHEKLVSKIKYWLKQALNGEEAKIFFDKESIETGDLWRIKIEDALKKSKCLVAIFSPDYFKSKWCYAEVLSFIERQNMFSKFSGGIIVGARFHDGHSFPDKVKNIQQSDFRDFAYTFERFWDTEDAVHFEKEIKSFCEVLAKKIRKAPDFDQNFPVIIPNDDELISPQITSLI